MQPYFMSKNVIQDRAVFLDLNSFKPFDLANAIQLSDNSMTFRGA